MKHKCSSAIYLGLVLCSQAAMAAEYSGFPVTYKMLPAEATAAVPIDITTDQFKARLKSGGTLILDGNELVLAEVNHVTKSIAFIAVDRVELKNGAKIVTNGNTLVLFTNTFSSDNGQVISFNKEETKTAKSGEEANPVAGASGNPGQPGLSGGLVSIHVIQALEGKLAVNLDGQNGGTGSNGRQGGKGTKGSRGTDAQDGPAGWLIPGWCARGGGGGAQGGKGFPGGNAGTGGPGGEGGIFELVNVGPVPVPSAAYSFRAIGGSPGANGLPGEGGPGGDGGEGGHGSTWCHGGNGGPIGPSGDKGYVVSSPIPKGIDGRSIVKNLDLEVMIRAAVMPVR